MAKIPNSINILGTIAPVDDRDLYPTHEAKYGRGGYVSIDEIANLSPLRIEEGMLVYETSTGKEYRLLGSAWEEISSGGAEGGFPILGADLKILPEYIPDLAISNTFVVASEVAMLDLVGAETGDIVSRTDTDQSFILAASPPSTLSNWVRISPNIPVSSVSGRTGNIVLAKSDVGLSNVDNTSDLSKPISTATQTALDGKLGAVPIGGFIESPKDKTYPIIQPTQSYVIQSLRIKTLSGTCTVAIQIDDVSVTGLGAVAVTSSSQLISATALNAISSGNRVTLVISANATAVDLEFTLMLGAV